MLTQDFPRTGWTLISRGAWRPVPLAGDRQAWEGLPEPVRRAYMALGEKTLAEPWTVLPAVRYLDFARDGNRSRFEGLHFARRSRLTALVVAECMEGRGRFLDEIVNGLWLLCEESSWCLPAHVSMQKAGTGLPDTTEPIVDLFAAETGALAAWTAYLLGRRLDAVSPLVGPRLCREVQTRILEPCRARDDFWWMGLRGEKVNNWNPWVVSNWLACSLLLEPDEALRAADAAKAMRCLDAFIDPYPADGGCDEGPGYWHRAGASLFDCLDLLHDASGGGIDVFADPKIRAIGRFIVRMQVAGDYVVNFADAPALVHPDAMLVFRMGRRLQDADMISLGAWAAEASDLWRRRSALATVGGIGSLGRLIPGLFALRELEAVPARAPLPRDTWLHVIQVMTARDRAGSEAGFFVAAKGGHNAESHNQNDVGQLIVYLDGRPLLIDAGVETYTRKTFSDQRYEIWTMQSGWHNLPTIGGVQQADGREFAARDVAYACEDAGARLTLDIAGAYPPASRLRSWVRTIALRRGEAVELTDRYALSAPMAPVTLSLLTPCAVRLASPGRMELGEATLGSERRSGKGMVSFDPAILDVTAEPRNLDDPQLRHVWGPLLTRLVFTVRTPALEGGWTIRVTSSLSAQGM